MVQPLLKLEKVSKQYAASADAGNVDVLRDVDLALAAGESLAIVGPSGCGKSTLLNLIGTLDQPTSGRIWLDGIDLMTVSEKELSTIRNRRIGFIFQAHHLLPQCSVLENVLVPTLAGPEDKAREHAGDRARKLLQRVGMETRWHHRPGQLSGGERQRVSVVRALINSPKLLLADEPTGALDRTSAGALGELLAELNHEEGVTLILVTHALDLAGRMQRVLELREGKLVTLEPRAAV
ncbi:MAG: lipoprotein-releasing system ATP-binding protein [Verrucomicrobiota bacterium]